MAILSWQALAFNYLMEAPTVTLTPSAGSNASFPVANLFDYARWKKWKSAAAGAQTLTIDLGMALQVTGIGIANHNANSGGWSTVKLNSSTNGTTWVLAANLTMPNDQDYFNTSFGAVVARYWQFSLGGAASAPQVGAISLGRLYRFQESDPGGATYEWDFNVQLTRGESQVVFADQIARKIARFGFKRTNMKLATGWIGETPIASFMDPFSRAGISMLDTQQGALKPFFYIPRPTAYHAGDGYTGVEGNAFYCRLPSRYSLTESFNEVFDDQFGIEEEA